MTLVSSTDGGFDDSEEGQEVLLIPMPKRWDFKIDELQLREL